MFTHVRLIPITKVDERRTKLAIPSYALKNKVTPVCFLRFWAVLILIHLKDFFSNPRT